MLSKKGITEAQFNWIFIGIAGAIILLLFFSFAQKQKAVAEEKSNIEVGRNLQSILTGAEVSKQTENVISVPDKEIRYSCEGFSIEDLSAFNTRVVFSPEILKSNSKELIFYSLEWRVPFRITNFLYVTSPEVRYVIVDDNNNLNDNSIANQLFKLLPENINKKIINENNLNDISDENNYKIKIISFNNLNIDNINLDNIKNTKKEDISIINIKEINEGIDGYGKIDFYEFKDFKKTTSYLKKESIIGAVFSENYEIYECNMKKAMKKLEKVYDVYYKRNDKIMKRYESIGNVCKDTNYGLSLLQNPDSKIDINNFKKIYDNANELGNKNQIAQLKSCALIY